MAKNKFVIQSTFKPLRTKLGEMSFSGNKINPYDEKLNKAINRKVTEEKSQRRRK